jgi:hypothetical protein
VACLATSFATAVACLCVIPACGDEPPAAERFAGFPPIGKYRPGERTRKVITSDAVTGVRRAKWTRAMTDLGGWPAMFRFQGTIYLVFPHVDGHRGKRLEGTGKLICYASKDDGRTWVEQPTPPPQHPEQGTPEYVVAGDRVFSFEWNTERQTLVRVSSDGVTWSDPQPAYKRPFYFWGAMYDPVSRMFWAPPHAIPSAAADPGRQIHLVNSKDGVHWDYVSTVAPFNNASESILRFEEDRTMVVIIRRKYGREHTVAVAKPPYTEWQLQDRPGIVEGEHFFDIAGQTFVAARANYTGDNPAVKANAKVFDGRRSHAIIYRWTNDRRLEPWAVVDSMGDCSYPFLVETPTEVLCAYYSQHEDGVCKVFLAGFDKKEFVDGTAR